MSSPHSQSELNSWLVEEMYEQFRDDPSELTESWQDFFADYRPTATTNGDQPASGGAPPEVDQPVPLPAGIDVDDVTRLRGAGARIVENMEQSLTIPTATSVRDVPAKLLEINRTILNNYLGRTRGGKVSFTHLIAFAMVRAVREVPAMTNTYVEVEGKPSVAKPEHFGLGLAVDVAKDDGTRTLLVPVIRDVDTLGFEDFLRAYEEVIRKIRTGKLSPDMFAGATLTVTNPGTIGTVHSVPRLMPGQAAILGVGAINYPAEYQAADPATIAQLGISKVISLTSTYDHRVIQGAESGMYLQRVHELLLGEHDFYDEVFQSMELPYEPARWRTDSGALDATDILHKQMKVDQLANMYRVRGHLIADLDPLRQEKATMHPELDPTYYGLSIWDNDREFLVDVGSGPVMKPLGTIMGILRDAYCRTIGVEFGHVLDPQQKQWWKEHLEGVDDEPSTTDKRWILDRLNAADAFESFLGTKYIGQKRFGLEGSESLIPLMDSLLEAAADDAAVSDIVMGMAHRGRLNVLVNIMDKDLDKLFREFDGDIDPDTVQGSGDVKYHLGQESTYTARSGNELALHLPPNPSHLEAVDPVVEGIARAMQDTYDVHSETGTYPVLPLLLHGDAAFAGQGVVGETMNLSMLRGYRTGGTVHVVINNQVGFTASPEAARSSFYATDIAKMVQAPILHVNGDDPEACVRVAKLAFAYRQTFHRDVVIDLIAYRRHGHNEADDPSYTQPGMYKIIENQRPVRKLYTERLVRRGDISIDQAEEFLEDFEEKLRTAFDETRASEEADPPTAAVPPETRGPLPHVKTGVARDLLDRIASAQFDLPDGFTRHPKLDRIFDKARQRYDKGEIDWGLGETLALGSLLAEGFDVRLSGEDSRRGTFSHRHAVQVDYETGAEHQPLSHLDEDQGRFFIYDSLLSEFAVLGFEFGYATEARDTLVAWEAQFGDFANGGQVVIDQYIVASEDKWNLTCGLVLLLPHGYEGQGPEHSSARIERFLTLCAEDNIQVANATNAAQYFHLLRRQMHRDVRKPLVVFTPKSLLRSRDAYSDLDEFVEGTFQEVLDDPAFVAGDRDRADVESVVLCSGKVAYDLMAERDERDAATAVARVEQLYPWPEQQVADLLASYPNARDVVWAQEEPKNMGPWGFVDGRLWNILNELPSPESGDRRLRRVSRVASASPATGSHVVHQQELAQLLDQVFTLPELSDD
ncbi:multifunctional oxoglutarate decarboxylase/oxoglutarate dehydrogenase thiamine pyrophosphate-binding subunit/dihydrolipoyllysine-residue succinyltransferase subunit [Salsipaludibacter albus]|uniref:multifunctional oxoglutarate decarboxylase/oxoglutarate dehydrogenase thiamine pyrophosphate-binding subunit/dihydrolipoyllysine-residue succinyltransferase subunit n=1 Tax=Salsipaludibacter albus TaxID=2849650 RepID=UPI001EE3CEDB|nr:multifunctional oxoglutarate decarboxylase/oxoglutarate dehydrogenase thiamine pyrophosphate-binding subunit/dihydrolipoyllysine-residue succinyltransferase subunit [Salsipaludibacter albus]MBY5160917.1 multifunctional oxoglutarate decarboxylase/oxoglutarate dehydrogenase thiamine pyrophosphate-binding subunit/dihydrolipoyllysine-residue succinyltransferase subunit [Salsipaludibacter albus]